jgi:integrase
MAAVEGRRGKKLTEIGDLCPLAGRAFFRPSTVDRPGASSSTGQRRSAGPRLGAGSQARRANARGRSTTPPPFSHHAAGRQARGGHGGAVLRRARRIWTPATVAAGLPGLRIHDLRHTAVALWIAAGASPKEVAQRAGHTSVSFVLDRYGHLFPESDAALRERLDVLFRQATEHGRNTAG